MADIDIAELRRLTELGKSANDITTIVLPEDYFDSVLSVSDEIERQAQILEANKISLRSQQDEIERLQAENDNAAAMYAQAMSHEQAATKEMKIERDEAQARIEKLEAALREIREMIPENPMDNRLSRIDDIAREALEKED